MAAPVPDRPSHAVRDKAGIRLARGQGRRRPDLAGFLVAKVKRLAGAIPHRIVRPGRKPVLARVQAPAEPEAGLRDDRAETVVGQNVAPGDRRAAAAIQIDAIGAVPGREAAEPVVEQQPLRTRGRAGFGLGRHAARIERRRRRQRLRRRGQCVRQAIRAAVQNQPRQRLRRPKLIRRDPLYPVKMNAAHAAKPLAEAGLAEHLAQARHHRLVIARGGGAEDQEVALQPVSPPPLVRPDGDGQERRVLHVPHPQKDDRQIARDTETPEIRLAGKAVARLTGVIAGHRPDQAARKRLRVLDLALRQAHPVRRHRRRSHGVLFGPCQRGKVVVAPRDVHRVLPRPGREHQKRDLGAFPGGKRQRCPQGRHRVETGARAHLVQAVARGIQTRRARGIAVPAEECHAVRLGMGDQDFRVVAHQPVQQHRRTVLGPAPPAGEQKAGQGLDGPAFDEHLAEGRVPFMRRVGREDDLRGIGDLDPAGASAFVLKSNTADRDIVGGGDRQVERGRDAVAAGVKPGLLWVERHVGRIVVLAAIEGPDRAVVGVLQEQLAGEPVAANVGLPAGQRRPVPPERLLRAVAHPGREAAVPDGVQFRLLVPRAFPAVKRRGPFAVIEVGRDAGVGQVLRRVFPRHAFVQQKLHRRDPGVPVEAPDKDVVLKRIADGREKHALVMRHVRSDRRRGPARLAPRGREVERLEQPEAALHAHACEALQVVDRRHRAERERQRAGVGGHDVVLCQPVLQA